MIDPVQDGSSKEPKEISINDETQVVSSVDHNVINTGQTDEENRENDDRGEDNNGVESSNDDGSSDESSSDENSGDESSADEESPTVPATQ